MSVFLVCERTLGLVKGRPLQDLSSTQRQQLEALNYEGLLNSNAQEEAVTCVRHFAQVRNTLLQLYPFVCAKRHVALAPLDTVHTGWKNSYSLPSDCLRPLQFVSHGSMLSKSKYELFKDSIATDASDVFLRYTSKLEDTEDWDSVFTNCFCLSLAAEICVAVTGAIQAPQSYIQQFQLAIQEGYRIGMIDEVPGQNLDCENNFNTYNINRVALVEGGVWF